MDCQANCPLGKFAISGSVSGNANQMAVVRFSATADGTGWFARMRNVSSATVPAGYVVDVFARCVNP